MGYINGQQDVSEAEAQSFNGCQHVLHVTCFITTEGRTECNVGIGNRSPHISSALAE
eukprot:CAMPEP_0180635042 /NCGR_PEP_ID=MMETSP1037_2-20121125/42442_1 /TAXON_ID=632150 /ORGANISM="Azadinium spinosum, Strain 3D9" /LENGTH=56 /DNA_ID=CAMNT_0022656201 /DNA_START=103 /DNA_END=273 /DNA_ORIENTATION=+